MKEVARAAGVGTTTVSRVLNKHPNISPKTRQRVLGAIESLGYLPDAGARSFRSGQTQAVSVLLPMIGTPFYESLLTAVYGRLAEHGYDMALFPLVGPAQVRRHRDPAALMYRADALLITSQNPDDLYAGSPPFRKPVVLLDSHHPRYHSVSFDNRAAGWLAADHAVSLGQPIVFLDGADQSGVPSSPVFVERRRAILDCFTAYGVRPALSLSVPTSLDGFRCAAGQLSDLPGQGAYTVLAMSDDLALGLLGTLSPGGPDLRYVGFDGSVAARQAGIASVRQPTAEMGEAAAAVVLDAVRGELPSLVQRLFPPSLVPGD